MASKSDIRITVIITIHNAEKYLEECLNSVCSQTFHDIEILCIDGGSTDATPSILRHYEQLDSRLYIINDSNTSYGHKVNVGIENAKGEYIAVLESDDMFKPDMLRTLYQIAEKYHPDFVNGEYEYFFNVGSQRFIVPHQMYQKQPYDCLIENDSHLENMEIMDRFWTGIYRKDFLNRNGIRLNESPGAAFQDMSFRFLTSVLAKTSYHSKVPVYQYRMDNPGSSMKDPSKTVVIADEHDFLTNELRKRDIRNKEIWELKYYWKYMDFYGNLCRLEGAGRQALAKRHFWELKQDMELASDYFCGDHPYASKDILNHPDEFLKRIENEFKEHKKNNDKLQSLYYRIGREGDIVIVGCGKRGQHVFDRLLYSVQERICCFADNFKDLWGTEKFHKPIVSPEEAASRYPQALYLVANKDHAVEMGAQLQNYGIDDENIRLI